LGKRGSGAEKKKKRLRCRQQQEETKLFGQRENRGEIKKALKAE
jgi:hypothetical protein